MSLCEIYMNLARAFIIRQRDRQDRVKETKVVEHSCALYCVRNSTMHLDEMQVIYSAG